jgi:hypothetical protein
MDRLTIEEIARQLCDDLDKDVNEVIQGLKNYLERNPMSLKKLNEKCWEDSSEIFDQI